jgi:hypothetical protein
MTTVNNNRPNAPLLPRQAHGDQNTNIRQASRQLNWLNNPFVNQKTGYIDLANVIRQILNQLGVQLPTPSPAPSPIKPPDVQPVYGVVLPPDVQPVYGVIQPPDIQPVYGVVLPPDGMAQPVYGVIQPDIPLVSVDDSTPIQAIYGAIVRLDSNDLAQ